MEFHRAASAWELGRRIGSLRDPGVPGRAVHAAVFSEPPQHRYRLAERAQGARALRCADPASCDAKAVRADLTSDDLVPLMCGIACAANVHGDPATRIETARRHLTALLEGLCLHYGSNAIWAGRRADRDDGEYPSRPGSDHRVDHLVTRTPSTVRKEPVGAMAGDARGAVARVLSGAASPSSPPK